MNETMSKYSNYAPTFCQLIQPIFLKSSMQKKYILKHFVQRNNLFWQRAERFAKGFMDYLVEIGITLGDVADAYLKMCGDMLAEQIKFKKTGKYSCESEEQANAHIYLSEEKMTSYMHGLALSQFLWPNHYRMYSFFIRESKKLSSIDSLLEVGPGHGLYLVESMHSFPEARFYAVDISPISARISETLIAHFIEHAECKFQVKNINRISHGSYDYIVMCEVLEHLNNPESTMIKIHDLLNEQGHCFITTCANCPAIDHVYLFESIEDIRQKIQEQGFKIISDLSLPIDDFPESQWVKQKIEINYASMLKKV